MSGEDVEQLSLQRRSRQHPIEQVRPIERADEFDRIPERQLRRDVAPHTRRRGCGVGVQADAGEQVAKTTELAVLRVEVLPRLTGVVRFGNGAAALAVART